MYMHRCNNTTYNIEGQVKMKVETKSCCKTHFSNNRFTNHVKEVDFQKRLDNSINLCTKEKISLLSLTLRLLLPCRIMFKCIK